MGEWLWVLALFCASGAWWTAFILGRRSGTRRALNIVTAEHALQIHNSGVLSGTANELMRFITQRLSGENVKSLEHWRMVKAASENRKAGG